MKLRSAAAASALLLAIAGCAGTAHPAADPGPGRSVGDGPGNRRPPQLTVAQARQVFNAFWPRFEELATGYSPGGTRRLTTGAELQAQLFFKGTSGPTITKLTGESFYVPRLTGYPRWFWAVGRDAAGHRNGHLFVMVQAGPSAPWKTVTALYDLDSGARMLHYLADAISKDAQGYAEQVTPDDATLDVPPSGMSATYASYLNGQAPRATRGLFQPGPDTTSSISLDRELSRGVGQYGWRDTDRQRQARLPVWTLLMRTGGAIVIFSTYDVGGWIAQSSSSPLPAQPTGREAYYVPPAFVLQNLGLTSVTAGLRLTVTAVDRVLAFVEPHGVGPIYVLVNNGAAVRVSDSGPGG